MGIYLLLSIQLLLSILIIYKLYHTPKVEIKKDNEWIPRPIDPNTVERPCQFCGGLPAQKGIDGYWICGVCKIRKFNRQ